MKLVVIGDIHGNFYALESVIEDALSSYQDDISGFIFTGDYMGDFPDGSKVVELIEKISSKFKTYIIRGNRETGQVVPYLKAVREGTEPNWSLDTTMGSALVACRELGRENLEYLESLPDTVIIREEGSRPIFVKHKMPLTPEELELVKKEQMVVLTAHTHESHTEEKDGIKLFNAGSCGLSDEGIQGAIYGILESDLDGEWHMTIRETDYDYVATIDSVKSHTDLYERCQGWGKALELSVLTGINCTALYAFEVKRLALIAEEAREQGIEPDFSPVSDLNVVFGQGRYGNLNYDGSQLTDIVIEDTGIECVFGKAKVITSEGRTSIKSAPTTPEMYEKALENITTVALAATREIVFEGRHESLVKTLK